MEVMHFSHSIIDLAGLGDIAIPIRTSTDILFKPTSVTPPEGFRGAVFEFGCGGTGFLISISEIQINGAIKNVGLLLTAAHVVFDIMKGKPKKLEFSCKLENQKETAYLLKEFSSNSTADHRSNITDSLYCLPGDVAILLVSLDNCRASMYFEPFDQPSKAIGMDCYIPGFPKEPPNFSYCIPNQNLFNDKLSILANKIFNNFSGIVFSHGSVIDQNDKLLEVDCSTISGMSGSPIVFQGKYIGVYVGGPALPGQKELIDAIKCVGAENYAKAAQVLNSTICYDKFYDFQIFKRLLKNPLVKNIDIFAKVQLNAKMSIQERKKLKKLNKNHTLRNYQLTNCLELCYTLLYELVCYYNDRSNYKANLGISYENEVFREVELYVEKFLSIKTEIFSSMNDVVSYLTL